jgi:hypothetical protein
MGVAKIDGEVMYEPLHIRPLTVPFRHTMHRERMSQVMQPRLKATTIRTPDTGTFSQPAKGAV